ncbi:MAG: queuosine precursor transporter [Dehalococcoidia bacterium]|nr:queuosine precursor transporter [Dehalococcoidia bacterium]
MKATNRLLVLAALFVTCLITANIIAVKIIGFGLGSWDILLPASIIVFPLTYVMGDVLTEVYGYRWARRVIWLGFACNLIFVFFAWVGGLLPGAVFWEGQGAYENILGNTPRLLIASFAAYLVGSFSNSVILSRLKLITAGRWLWLRTIGSTIVGEGLDTVIFITIAFYGTPDFLKLCLYHWCGKVLLETLFTPLIYKVVSYLKRAEGIDTFDKGVDYNPFLF